jgi:hypothetical protein
MVLVIDDNTFWGLTVYIEHFRYSYMAQDGFIPLGGRKSKDGSPAFLFG